MALCTRIRTDNRGPSKRTVEVVNTLNAIRREYPGAAVIASSFDAFVEDILPVKDQLPVTTSEIGDTWIYGVPSDPLKMAQNREIQRIWIKCLNHENESFAAACGANNPTIQNMTRFLLKIPEHTWGLPTIAQMARADYAKVTLRMKMGKNNYLRAAASWSEQRLYNELAVQALEHGKHAIAAEVRSRVDALSRVSATSTRGFRRCGLNEPIFVNSVRLEFGKGGEITSLYDEIAHTQWASKSQILGKFTYQTLNDTDWKFFARNYMNSKHVESDFAKIGSNAFSESKLWSPQLQDVYVSKASGTVLLRLRMPRKAYEYYGAPTVVEVFFVLRRSKETARILELDYTLTWLNKSATLIGESSMIVFKPAGERVSPWSIDKLGSPIDPEDVLAGGNQMNHASWGGVTVSTTRGEFQMESLDAAIFCPTTPEFPHGFPLPGATKGLLPLQRGSVDGFGLNLHNNLWNTNYPAYYPYYDPYYCSNLHSCRDSSLAFRFKLKFRYYELNETDSRVKRMK